MIMRVSKDEKRWLTELESHRGWTDGKGDPKKLNDWAYKLRNTKGTDYRVIETNGVTDYAWNPRKFDPKNSVSGTFTWLSDFSGPGGNLNRSAELVRERLTLPTLYIAEAIIKYWRDEINVLVENDGILTLSDEYFPMITSLERYLEVNDGLISVPSVAERFGINIQTVVDNYHVKDESERLITNEIVLDLQMASIDAGWVSKLISDGSNVVPMVAVAQHLGLLGGGVSMQQADAVEVARRVSNILSYQYPEFNMNPEGDSLNVGNEAEVIRAHIKLAEDAQIKWEENQKQYAEQRAKQEEEYDQVEQELMEQEGSNDTSEADLIDQALQAEFLKRLLLYLNRR